jgi:TPR repeat protein
VTWSGKKNETGTDGVKRSRTEGGQYTEEKFFYYCGSNSFSPVELGKFGFNQAQLHGHQPEQLQGWTVVENKFAQADISRYAQERVETEERARCAGAVNTLDSFQCQFQTQGPYLVYMPVWTVDYKYKGKAFRAIVRDQDNTVFGSRPLCKRKLTIMLWLIIAIFAACIGVYLWNSYFSGHSAQQAPTARPPSVTLPGASSTTGGESNEKQLASSTQPEIQTPNAQPIAKANPPSINRTPGSTQTASPNPAGSETVSPAEALYKKGLQYYLGEKGVPIQQGDGIELFQQAANQQFPEAEARMAIFSHYGWGGDIDINGSPSTRVERDPQLAENLAKDAINQGLIARAASLGGDSAVTLGDLYLRGIGVKEDDSKAIEQYRNAADQGLPEAQYDLGFCYSQGEGVAQDKAEAAKYYREAADQGLAEAQTALGLCYETGDGVQKDLGKAIRYYKEAANQGEPAAKAVIRLRFSPPQNSGGDNGASTTNPSASPIQPSSDSDNAIGASLGAATSSLPTDPAMFAEDYVNSLGSNDPEIPLVYFGETVAYYDNGNVGTAFLRNDLEHDIKKWSNRRYSIFGEPKILQSSDGYTAEFIMDYTLSNPRVFCLRRNDLKG